MLNAWRQAILAMASRGPGWRAGHASLGMRQLPVNDADRVQVSGGVAWKTLSGGTPLIRLQGLVLGWF